MKLVVSSQGIVAAGISADDVSPERGLLYQDLIQYVGDMYNFAVRPDIPPNIPIQAPPFFLFQQGRFVNNDSAFPVHQLAIFQNGDSVSAMDTDVAEMILDDYTAKLDANFGFRFANKPQKRYYLSSIVVELAHGIGKQIAGLRKIGEILTREIPREGMPFDTKALAFGWGDPAALTLSSPALLERADFTIERRAGEPYERNRYFSSAPVRTSEHVRILELIEAAIGV